MSFVNPVMLAVAAGLLAVPLAVHLLTRPRPVRFPFSAVRFLDSALRQRRFFARLRDALLLGLRMLLLAAIALAFARPLIEGAAGRDTPAPQRRLVVLDCSRSMDARRGGVRVFERAHALALRLLRAESGVRANLILAAARPRAVFEEFSSNYPALQAEARNARVRQEALDVSGALARAAEMLSAEGAAHEASELVIVTDLQAGNWDVRGGAQLPASTSVRFEYVGLDRTGDNLAVTEVCPAQRPCKGRDVLLTVDVGNFSGAPHGRQVVVTANRRVYRRSIECGPWDGARATFRIPDDVADAAGGWVSGTARILEARDALPADDTRHFAFRVQEPPRFCLISREDPTRVGTGSYFVWRMLDPGSPGMAERTHLVSPPGLEPDELGGADLLVLNKPGLLEPEGAQLISGLLLRGTPVLYLLSEEADARNLEAIRRACGGQLRLPVQLGATGARADGFELASAESSAEPFRSMGEDLPRMLRWLRVHRLLATTAAPEPRGQVLASWDDGSAAMFRTVAKNGTLVAWNGAVEDSSLPRSALFVALMRELALQLTRGPGGTGEPFPSGEARLLDLPPEVEPSARPELLDADGRAVAGFEPAGRAEGLACRWNPVSPPGVYRVTVGGETALTVASGCPAEESDLRRADADGIVAAMQAPVEGSARRGTVTVRGLPGSREATEEVETWPWLVVVGIVAMVLELAVLKVFRI
ncbi:MAG: BatA domain-containing protein [Candidatus Brocadiia bacterium]